MSLDQDPNRLLIGKPGTFGQSHRESFRVNARCLDEWTAEKLVVSASDGREGENLYPEGRGAQLED